MDLEKALSEFTPNINTTLPDYHSPAEEKPGRPLEGLVRKRFIFVHKYSRIIALNILSLVYPHRTNEGGAAHPTASSTRRIDNPESLLEFSA
ncbi:Uncharacterised protein [Corynebacterium striatum]|uniref:Uncharacterized protein n=1 Tax=Corynebacterium striatum TaxID=43770 RepID=A0AAQ1TYD9_CORST|nr:hypothetical protein [Corynebacterium striatum]QQE52175.1 hypothetical protein I6I11_08420 [Corynebacterium striatum]GEA43120.1 hypothetical protein Cst04h_12900 [Corynebacterium striatum]STD63249.1 Uncharacterised protein [Corynebacterium striatum]HCD3017411.1 hypothetical protein [Corynebacterium striatum]